jgi:glycerol-3-phosphate dehydrogenase
MQVDTLIFGGGAAGLWLLDELTRQGSSAVLLEAAKLGQGQTIASQGIIHGGLKYTLQGLLTRSAAAIREMPHIWRECLSGRRAPDLSGTRVRAECCHLWRTHSVRSRLGMIGARFGLRVTPAELSRDERPLVLRDCPGTVARLDEQVISPAFLLADLSDRHQSRILQIDSQNGLAFDIASTGHVCRVRLVNPQSRGVLELRPAQLVFAAGAGNAQLRKQAGLSTEVLQRRPLHMVLLRGTLPQLNGHCVDGARTRVTITSDTDSAGRTVWQVGGQIAEDGVQQEPQQLIAHTAAQLQVVLPGLDLTSVEFSTYRVDRAEGSSSNGRRPNNVQILYDGNIVTAWPTKLALVPQLAETIAGRLSIAEPASSPTPVLPADWPRPVVAATPWETCSRWCHFDSLTDGSRRAA